MAKGFKKAGPQHKIREVHYKPKRKLQVRFLGILCLVLFALQLPSYLVFRSFPEPFRKRSQPVAGKNVQLPCP